MHNCKLTFVEGGILLCLLEHINTSDVGRSVSESEKEESAILLCLLKGINTSDVRRSLSEK